MIIQRFRFNFIFKVLGEFLARISSFLFYAIGARILGVEDFGLFSLSFSYAFIIIILLDLGTHSIITRDIARDPSRLTKLFPTVTTFKLILMPLAFLLIHLLMMALGYDQRMIRVTDLMSLAAIGTGMGEYLTSILNGVERMDVEAFFKTIWKIGLLVFSYVVFKIFGTLESFVIGMAVGQWIGVLIGLVWIHMKLTPFKFALDKTILQKLISASWPLFVAWLFIFLYDNQDLYFLSWLKFSHTDMGLFSASGKLVDSLRPIPVLFMGAIYPILSETGLKDKKIAMKILKPILIHSIVFLIPVVFLSSLFASDLCLLMFGREYILAGPVLSVAIWGFFGIFLNHILLQSLVSLEGQKQFLISSILVAGLNALLCWTLFPRLGIIGGAWALVGAETVFLLINMMFLFNKLKEFQSALYRSMIGAFVPAVIGAVIWMFITVKLTVIPSAVITLIFYLVFVHFLRLIDWELIHRLKKGGL